MKWRGLSVCDAGIPAGMAPRGVRKNAREDAGAAAWKGCAT
jgi:hypothetical protein